MASMQDIKTSWVKVSSRDVQLDAYLAEPTEDGNFPAIVVIQEIFGVNSHIRDVTERFARLGYVAIAPAIYQRQAPGFETGYTAEDVKTGREYKNNTQATELLSDIGATVRYLQELPTVRAEAIGSIGFCFGGHVAYLTATLPGITAVASFYGAGIPDWCPGGGKPTLTYTADIQGVIYTFFGTEDASIPPDHVAAIEAALQNHHIPHKVFRYEGAQHGFFCDQRASYNAEAAADAWEQVQYLYAHALKGES